MTIVKVLTIVIEENGGQYRAYSASSPDKSCYGSNAREALDLLMLEHGYVILADAL